MDIAFLVILVTFVFFLQRPGRVHCGWCGAASLYLVVG